MTRFRHTGVQVLMDDEHFATARNQGAALMIVNALRALEEASDAQGRRFAPAHAATAQCKTLTDAIDRQLAADCNTGATRKQKPYLNFNTCRAVQQCDEMACPCGLRWDVGDPDPPLCVHRAPRHGE